MVLCIIPGCGVKSGNKEGISLFRIPIVVDNNGESYKQLKYCAKVMQTIIDEYHEYRDISAIFNEILP